MKKDSRDFLLEINTEELPAGYVKQALVSMKTAFKRELDAFHIGFNVRVSDYGTKNSLLCYIENLPLKQEEVSKEVLGPPKRIAFDEKGSPTKQAMGFAKNQGVKVKDLKIKKTPKGEYVVVEKKEKARSTKDILKEIAPRIVKNIYFPKTMRWDDSGMRFARPIESTLALFGDEIIDVVIDNIPQKKIKPSTPKRYLKTLGGLIDWSIRKEKIKRLISEETKRLGADQDINEDLLEEVTFLVNCPSAFTGDFDKKFLSLPKDVLKASMAKHQRIFPVSKNNKLINKFIAIIEGKKRNNSKVRKNYENILEAKLKDSLFFLVEDTKKPLSENIFQLKDLIFHKDLGSIFEKIERLKQLCSFVCDRLGDSSLKIDTERAAELSKADLVTHMVGEFPSLQGIMGREYALKSGEKKEVARAIGEHYLPQGINDCLPQSKSGAILGFCDKTDNMVGFLGIASEVSGSFDPFGIRRNALGFMRIILNKSWRIDLDELAQKAIELYGGKLKISSGDLKIKIANYIKDRIEFLMAREPGPALIDLRKAVLKTGHSDIVNTLERFKALKKIYEETYFKEAAKVVERTSNILKGAKKERIGEVNEDLFKEDLERTVWRTYLDSEDNIQGFIDKEEYREATREYARVFFKVLHDFFDKVLVNAEDRSLRLNRLAMMKSINRLYTERVADLAMLPQIIVK